MDTTPPVAPSGILWAQSSPTNLATIQAGWSTPSGDIDTQEVTFYTNPACTTIQSGPVSVSPPQNNKTLTSLADTTTYYFKVINYDEAGNSTPSICSSGLTTDFTGPVATNLSWSSYSVELSNSITANWTPSTAPDLASQEIQFFTDSGCTVSSSLTDTSLAAAANTHTNTATPDNTYYYKIKSTDTLGNEGYSNCHTPGVLVDLDPSVNIMTNLQWTQGAFHTSTTIDLTWNNSGHAEMSSLKYSTYSSADCTGVPIESDIALSITDTSANVTVLGVDGGRTMELIAYNVYNEEINKTCSPQITIDTVPPPSPIGLLWQQTSPTNLTTIQADWTAPSVDVYNQEITFYSDGACTSIESGPTTVAPPQNSKTLTSLNDATSYHFAITNYDEAGNTATSSCSSALFTDFSGPVATGLSWGSYLVVLGSNITANWTPAPDADLQSQDIMYFTNNTCTTSAGLTNATMANTSVNSHTHSGTPNGSYYFLIRSTDTLGNVADSECHNPPVVLTL